MYIYVNQHLPYMGYFMIIHSLVTHIFSHMMMSHTNQSLPHQTCDHQQLNQSLCYSSTSTYILHIKYIPVQKYNITHLTVVYYQTDNILSITITQLINLVSQIYSRDYCVLTHQTICLQLAESQSGHTRVSHCLGHRRPVLLSQCVPLLLKSEYI